MIAGHYQQKLSNQALHGRIVKDRIRLWQEGFQALVRELCCALLNFWMRLTP